MVDAARARLDAIENANERERLVREYAEKERRLRQELETAEAGYRRATSELAERRERDEHERLADAKAGERPAATTSPAPAGGSTAAAPEAAVRVRENNEREQQAKEQTARAEQERLASQVAAFEADKARLADERQALELAMTERLARAQAERERAEKRLAVENARLPVLAVDQSRTTAPGAQRRRAAATCQEINARAQLGDLSEADRDTLRHLCR
jgi:hypothetical protein